MTIELRKQHSLVYRILAWFGLVKKEVIEVEIVGEKFTSVKIKSTKVNWITKSSITVDAPMPQSQMLFEVKGEILKY